MTKEQMIAAISSLNVGDSRALEKRGGAFKDMLKEIVNSIPQGGNEPLIVEGELEQQGTDDLLFTPDGSITFTEAKEAFESGRNVILKVSSTDISKESFIKITASAKTPNNTPYLSGDFLWRDDLDEFGTKHIFWI